MRGALVLTVVISACGPTIATSYESATTATQSGRAWIVTVRGNSKVTPELILDYTSRKAAELCPDGYEVAQSSGGIDNTTYTNAGNGRTYSSKRADQSTLIRCKADSE